MSKRWEGTRNLVRDDGMRADAAGLWGRIEQSVRNGESVRVPAADPSRRGRPVVIPIVLLVAAFAGVQVLLRQSEPRREVVLAGDAEDYLFKWLATPAYAQGNGASDLPPIARPDLTRMVPSRIVYRYVAGADGFVTERGGSDTTWIKRDSAGGVSRLLVRRVTEKMNMYAYVSSDDSMAIAATGQLLAWRWRVINRRNTSKAVLVTTLLVDSVQTTHTSARGEMRTLGPQPAWYEYQLHQPLVALLPSLQLERGYARSISVLDLLGGETTSGFRRSVEMRVTGKEWVDLPIGRFHCWIVDYSVVPDPGEKRYASRLYVDMQSGVLVRAVWRSGESFFTEQVLADRQLSNQ